MKHVVIDCLRSKTILRNLLFLVLMAPIGYILFTEPAWASEIVTCLEGHATHFTEANRPDSGANATGTCLCYSDVDQSLTFIFGEAHAAAWCYNHRVFQQADVRADPFDNEESYATARSTSMGTGLQIYFAGSLRGCDPGDVTENSSQPSYENCDPFGPAADCQGAGLYYNFSNGTCNTEPQTCGGKCAPYYPLESGGCEWAVDYCEFEWGCGSGFTDGGSGCCCTPTPILIDVAGNGYSLTNAYDGVHFDMGGDGHKEPIAWTTTNTDDAWLVLDRNGNRQIDSAKEMFGNFTEQSQGNAPPNGFIALAEFDKPENGGNGDRLITAADNVFQALRLWQDVNKDGMTQASELHSLKDLGLKTIELDYKESKRTDQHGNQFRYRAKVKDNQDLQIGRWAYDVILQVNPPPKSF